MISFTIKDDNGKKIRIEAPSSWFELTLKQIIQIENSDKKDLVALFSILTGVEIEFAKNSTDKKLEEYLWATIQFIASPPNWKELKHGEYLHLGDKRYKVPQNFRELMLGQKILIASEFTEETDLINKMPQLLAIIFQPIMDDGKFIDSRIPEVIKEMESAAGIECYSIASFFFALLWNSKRLNINYTTPYQSQAIRTLSSLASLLRLAGLSGSKGSP